MVDETTEKIKPVILNSPIEIVNDLKVNDYTDSYQTWIASNNGILNYNLSQYFTTSNSGLQNNNVAAIGLDKDGRVYCAWSNGISIYDQSNWVQYAGLDKFYQVHEISDLGTTADGYTYVGTKDGGVERFKCEVDGVSGATILDTDWTKLRSNTIYTVYTVDTIQAYGTPKGVAIHNSNVTKWDWEVYSTRDGLVSDTIISIVRDFDKTWWFGSYRGLSRYDGTQWTTYNVANSQMLSDTVRFLAVDGDGSLWMATDQGVSHRVDDQWKNILK
jgi:ligand-binding sensor domain-containing protein